ncbi:MAG: GntR family transcriptional regulator [Anaerolineales bacterium]|nr:MAG: GntR family transcriptional regulator [Anaerolineales bacterium]TEU11266.1 MAG: GntR family transcriptional regulator [Anaerolineales bacterium]
MREHLYIGYSILYALESAQTEGYHDILWLRTIRETSLMSDESAPTYNPKHQTMLEFVADRIRDLILSRQLEPGERLAQSQLAERFGVSRTPVREALQKLASEGLVTFSPYKGAFVAKFSSSELMDLYSIRIALEGYCASLAALRITDEHLEQLEALLDQMKEEYGRADRWRLLAANREFYAVLYAIPNQPLLYELTMKYLDMADAYRRMALAQELYFKHIIGGHEKLLTAMRQRNPETVERLLRVQMEEIRAMLLEVIQEGKGEKQALVRREKRR